MPTLMIYICIYSSSNCQPNCLIYSFKRVIRSYKPFLYSNPTGKNPLLPRFQYKNFEMQKMTSLGECYVDLKGYVNEGWKKKRTNEEKERNSQKKSKL